MLNKIVETAIAAVLLFPVFIGLNRFRFHNAGHTALYYVVAVYLAALYLFVGMPTVQFIRFSLSGNLIPFLPMLSDLKNTILNVMLFVPLGVLLPLLWVRYGRFRDTVAVGFGMSMSVELLQIFTYRATDINDLIANTAGAALVYGLFRLSAGIHPPLDKYAAENNAFGVLILPVVLVMFFLQPYVANLYYAVIF